MRKRGIVKDFKNQAIPGTLNQIEKTNFLTGKCMDIEDEIRVRTIDVWNNNIDRYSQLKEHRILSINIAKDQTQADKDSLTKWVIELDTKNLLRDYLYNEIYTENSHSVFNLLTNDIVDNSNTSLACYSYIDNNLINRYGIKEVIFWTKYYQLNLSVTPDSNQIPLLKQSPVYSFYAKPTSDSDKNKSIISTKTYTDGLVELNYKQSKSSQEYTFLYYYDIIFYKL